jgi:hypothetical protein
VFKGRQQLDEKSVFIMVYAAVGCSAHDTFYLHAHLSKRR